MKLFKLLFFATVFMTSCEEAPKTTGKPVDTKAIEIKKVEGTPTNTTALPIENVAVPKADAPKATTEAPKAATDAPKTAATMYECPMKCEKPSAKAGKCGKCGMDLKAIAQK
ncbi:MAG: Heavy metal binding domain [Bacteroidota bacterium]